ncbi:MAG: hypothetical protein HY608_02330 [Planctomycetes bacterium]|nr:hypothetical protein [Planctomycetota bacterium]
MSASAPASRLGRAALALALALAAHRSAVALRHDRAHPLALDIPAGAASPGEVAGGLLLGGFRGLFADLVWFRAQVALSGDRDDLYNLPALYEKLALLQPQYPEMWASTGDDLVFNAAAKFDTPAGQWTWIRLGVDWLRRGTDRIGSDRRVSHPRGHMVWESLGWAYLYKCTPTNEIDNGTVWWPLARSQWRADPFELSAEAFGTASRFPRYLAGRVMMDAHVLKHWALHTVDPVEEMDLLRRSMEVLHRHDRERGTYPPEFIRRHHWILAGLARAAEFRARLGTEADPVARGGILADAIAHIQAEALRDPDFSDDLPHELRKMDAPPEAYRGVARALGEMATASEARGDHARAEVCRERAALFLSWADYVAEMGVGAGN